MSTIDGDESQAVTIDGEEVVEITMDGDVVWQAIEIVDDFEDGNRSGWNVESTTGSDDVLSPGLQGTNYRWRLNGFREAHLPGHNAVDRGPQPGDQFEFTCTIENYTGSPAFFRFKFGASGVDDGAQYRIQYDLTGSDQDFSILKESGGSVVKDSTYPYIDINEGDTFRTVVGWNYGNNDIAVSVYLNGNYIDTASITDTEYSQPGIALFVNDYTQLSIDEIKISDTV